MKSEFGSGVFLPPEETGVTVVTETGTLGGGGGVVSEATTFPLVATLNKRLPVAVFVPSFSAAGSEMIVSVTPPAPSVPEAGVTVAHGLSVKAKKLTVGVTPGMKMVCRMVLAVPTSTLTCRCGVSDRTVTITTLEYGPRSSLQLLMARTR